MARLLNALALHLQMALLAIVLCETSLAATPLSPERSAQLTAYCAGVQSLLRQPALDPASISVGAAYDAPRPTAILGQKVQAASNRLALEGSLVLGLVINSVGRTANVSVLEKSEHAALDFEALDILRGADFAPATLDGVPVRACTMIRITFKVVA